MTPAKKHLPRVGIERQHTCAITGQLRWRAIHGPRAHYIIDPVVNDEYLSLEEHQELLREAKAEARVILLSDILRNIKEAGIDSTLDWIKSREFFESKAIREGVKDE